eukprot:scaffold774_cov248-Pinguiococcus_pyrenoidosus.AAC.7
MASSSGRWRCKGRWTLDAGLWIGRWIVSCTVSIVMGTKSCTVVGIGNQTGARINPGQNIRRGVFPAGLEGKKRPREIRRRLTNGFCRRGEAI